MLDKRDITDYFKQLQDQICTALEKGDGAGRFEEDPWERPGGGGGRTRVIQGRHIEKGGVNFSAVHGQMPGRIASALGVEPGPFLATGVSIVLHPSNPHVPIIHMNVRYFELEGDLWWFGGGIDLTPHYIIEEEARWFHHQLYEVCVKHDPAYYPRFSNWADEYFYLKHREETRGVGGIFFDRLNDKPREDIFAFVRDVGERFAPIYLPLLSEHKEDDFSEEEKSWQMLRRGRYVEFNLVWDKGTKFGLDTNGRTESILMSLPPVAHWAYAHQPKPGSPEHKTLLLLKKGQQWLNYKG